MNFERGRDVKEAAGIGIKETLPELKRCYRELVNFLEKYRNLAITEDITEEIRKSRPQRFVVECGWANMDVVFSKVSVEEYAKMYTVIMKWHKNLL